MSVGSIYAMLLGVLHNQTTGSVLSEKPSNRQAPGGDSSLLLGVSDADELVMVSSNKFANGANQNCGNMISDRPSTRVRQAPGGRTTICLSYDETPTKSASKDALKIFEESSSMKAAGGEALSVAGKSTLCFDTDTPKSSRIVSHRQAPGGASTLCLGYSPEIGHTPMKLQPPGGNSSICLGVHDDEVVLEVNASGRHPPGGDATVNLGGSNATRTEELEKPCRPFTAPGGTATICLGMSDDAESSEPQSSEGIRPVGGASTICLGLAEDETSSCGPAIEPSLARPIGGPSTICLGLVDEQEQEPQEASDRVAPGGATTICLGLAELSPRQHNDTRPPPGGNATICLDAFIEDEPSPREVVPSTARPIGGATTICLGLLDEPEDAKPQDLSDRMAPGGKTTICLGLKSFSPRERNDTRPPPGGNATICLGVENDENCNILNLNASFGDETCKKTPQILGTRPSNGMLVN